MSATTVEQNKAVSPTGSVPVSVSIDTSDVSLPPESCGTLGVLGAMVS